MPRYVILEHDYPDLHWDLMLEVGSVLKTWRLAKPPETTGEKIDAVPLGDHRVFYLDYEGPVSGERGSVTAWDRGAYETLSSGVGPEFRVVFNGRRLHGEAVLEAQPSGWVFWNEVGAEHLLGAAHALLTLLH
jgi:hypothetical protein